MELTDRIFDENGNAFLSGDAIANMLYKGKNIFAGNFYVDTSDGEMEKFNLYSDEKVKLAPSERIDNIKRRDEWFMPDFYKTLNLNELFDIMSKELPDIYKERIKYELSLYQEKGYDNFLRYCVYLSTLVNQKKIVVGCGRGSSCASYLLFLLGLHMVDSVKYDIDVREFLK